MPGDTRLKIEILLQEYRTISEEIQLYLEHIIKCFVYAALLVGVYLGWGLSGVAQEGILAQKIGNYIPYGFIVLAVYFLSLSYIRLNLTIYRSSLERKINAAIEDNLLGFQSRHLDFVQSKGFVRFSRRWYGFLPTPMVLLGVFVFVGSVLVFYFSNIATNRNLILALMIACGLAALYVFFVYPFVLKRLLNAEEDQTEHG